MKTFESISLLLDELKNDKETKSITEKRFPVRYIFISDFETLKKFIEKIKLHNIEIIELSKLLPKEDGWITKQELIEEIKNLDKSKDYLLLPFSEIVRFYNKQDFNNLFSQLNELENIGNNNQRIYIPLLGIKDRFYKEFFDNFNRKKEYAFSWEIQNPQISKIKTYLSNYPLLKAKNIQIVKNTKNWLKLWKHKVNDSILVLSGTLYFFSDNAKPDEIFEFTKLSNYQDIIKHLTNIEVPFKYDEKYKKYWEELYKRILSSEANSFFQLVKIILNVSKININNFLEIWLSPNRNEFEKWILKNYILSYSCLRETYLCRVLNNLKSFKDIELLKELWFNIFNYNKENILNKIFDQRLKLLNQFHSLKDIELPLSTLNLYKEKIEKLEFNNTLKYITGLLNFEKEILLQNYLETNDSALLQKLPEIKAYINNKFDEVETDQNWIISYLKDYKQAKLQNSYSKKISNKINEINQNEDSFYKWYFSFKAVKDILNNESFDYIFWIDALGIEWNNLIEILLLEKKHNVEKKVIGRVNIPTTTDKNRYDFKNQQYFQDFDKFIHDNYYTYPSTIFNEINKLKDIIKKINIEENKRAVIISDHGLSALVRLNPGSKLFNNAQHEGRYVKIENPSNYNADDLFIIKENFLIASKHISLSQKPKREVHGGCTPEEVLVPIIIFNSYSLEKDIKNHEYQIELLTKEIPLNKPIIKIKIQPSPSKPVSLLIKNKQNINMQFKEGSYFATLSINKGGKTKIKVLIGNFEKEMTVNIKSGLKENDLF